MNVLKSMTERADMSAFYLVSWEDNFFDALREITVNLSEGDLGKVILVFPSSRPRLYVIDAYKKAMTKPCILPKILTFGEVLAECKDTWFDDALLANENISELDSVALLYDIVSRLEENSKEAFFSHLLCNSHTQEEEREKASNIISFYSWGLELHALLNDCFEQNNFAFNIKNTESSVGEFAGSLLSNLTLISREYYSAVRAMNKSTPSIDKFTMAQKLENELTLPLPRVFKDKILVFAGFVLTSGTEDVILNYFAQKKASFCIHSDPHLVLDREKVHYSCKHHEKWIDKWNVQPVLCTNKEIPKNRANNIYFHQAYDVHSELHTLQSFLGENQKDTAIVLADEKILLPLLYCVPSSSLNISMGYPMKRSLLVSFVESIIELRTKGRKQAGKDKTYLFQSTGFLAFLRQPLLSVLCPTLKKVFALVEKRIYNDSAYIDVNTLVSKSLSGQGRDSLSSEEIRAYKELFGFMNNYVKALHNAETLKETAEAIYSLCSLFDFQGKEEVLETTTRLRLMYEVADILKKNTLADLPLGFDFCMRILQEKIKNERIPFERQNLEKGQVLGMLETRLLSFKTVHLLDASDDILPPRTLNATLLPDGLRTVLGLPTEKDTEILSAYTWYRLLASSEIVHIYWQEASAKGYFESKKTKSSFVEDAIWQWEKENNKILKPDNILYTQEQCQIKILSEGISHSIECTEFIRKQLDVLLDSSLFATQLDTYLTCPLKFFYKYLAKLNKESETEEGDEVLGVGDLIHDILCQFYTPYKGQTVDKKNINISELLSLSDTKLLKSDLRHKLTPESFLMFKQTLPFGLKKYIQFQPAETKILYLEDKCSCDLLLNDKTFTLEGRIDRVDSRVDALNNEAQEELVVFDYKTGKVVIPDESFWRESNFFSSLKNEITVITDVKSTKEENILLDELRGHLPSIQLPYYILLAEGHYQRAVGNAGYIDLGDTGEEKFIFNDNLKNEMKNIKSDLIPLIIKFLLVKLGKTTLFPQNISKLCDWCFYKKYCK